MAKYSWIILNIKNTDLIDFDTLSNDKQKALKYNNCIYIYHGSKSGKIYIGQTKHFTERHKQHYNGTEEKFNTAKFDQVIKINNFCDI